MRIRTGHKPDDWSASTPAATGPRRLGGELVVGWTGVVERERIRGRDGRLDYVTRERGLLKGCSLDGRCRHHPCTAARAHEAKRLYDSTALTLGQIGQMLGGRDHSTVINLLRIAAS